VIIYTLGISNLSLSHHHMGKISMTARPGADSEIFGEKDDRDLGLEPSVAFMGRHFLGCLGVKPRKVEYFHLSDSQFSLHFRT